MQLKSVHPITVDLSCESKWQRSASAWINNEYAKYAVSQATRKAYRSDIRHFEAWGGVLPATEEMIIAYLEHHATIFIVRTLARHLAALRAWHLYQGFNDPTAHPIIAKTLTGIMRLHGVPKKKARALMPEELQSIVSALNKKTTFSAIRDNALLQIGFFGALRRSELVAICYEQIRWAQDGIEILLSVSKTDQYHTGQYCVIPYGKSLLCPVTALKQWLNQAQIMQGAVFRRLLSNNQHVGPHALTPLSVNHILKKRALESGLLAVDQLSSHSLRRGLATSAARAKVPLPAIMRAGRWKQTNTVMEYIEESERFTENAAAYILQQMKS